ncbi:MAG: hypothetical protein ABEH83_04680 [Halobacterium sp.]
MASERERLLCWGIGGLGAFVAAAAAYALFGVPVSSPAAAAVRSVAVVAGLSVTVGAVLAAAERVSVRPVVPVAAGPGALAGAAIALSGDGLPMWVHVVVGAAVACGVLGYALVLAENVEDARAASDTH